MPRYSRYSPPTNLTTENQNADVCSTAPSPSSETASAVESPSATAAIKAALARRPCDTEYPMTVRMVGPGVTSNTAEAATKASQSLRVMNTAPAGVPRGHS